MPIPRVREFIPIPYVTDAGFDLCPFVFVEILDALAEAFLGFRVASGENEVTGMGVGEAEGFAEHVGLFGAGEGDGKGVYGEDGVRCWNRAGV